MVRSRRGTFLCICALLLACGVARAQDCEIDTSCALFSNSGAPPSYPFVSDPAAAKIYLEVEEVQLTVSVTDQHHRPVRGLKAEDFLVHDNNQPVRVRASPNSDLQLRIGVLVDWSESLRKELDFLRRSATVFLARMLRPSVDEGFVINFASQATLAQAPTGDTAKLTSTVHPLNPRLTALYDALVLACDLQNQAAGNMDPPQRRALLLLSDGNDTDSYHTLQDSIAAAQRSDTAIYAISRHRGAPSRGDLVLEKLAEETGGQAFVVANQAGLDRAFQMIEDNLRAGYLLSFQPAKLAHDGRYHRLAIVPLDRNLRIRARSGYFEPCN